MKKTALFLSLALHIWLIRTVVRLPVQERPFRPPMPPVVTTVRLHQPYALPPPAPPPLLRPSAARAAAPPPPDSVAATVETAASTPATPPPGTPPPAAGATPPPAPPTGPPPPTNLSRYIYGPPGASPAVGTTAPSWSVPRMKPFSTQDLQSWARRCGERVAGNWNIPAVMQTGRRGLVSISVTLEKSGRLVSAEVVHSSRVPAFDEAALAAVRLSSPLPSLPEEFRAPQLTAVLEFTYHE